MRDPIVEEVRRVRDALAARCDYDLDALYRGIKEREKISGLEFVRGVARQPVPLPAPPTTSDAGSAGPLSRPLDADTSVKL